MEVASGALGAAVSARPTGLPEGIFDLSSGIGRTDGAGAEMMRVIRLVLAAAGRWLRSVRPERRSLRADMVAGLTGAISSVPDGMSGAVLAGVNPVQGLYASFAGPVAGGLSSSTRLMLITTTSAASLAAGSALQSVPANQRPGAVVLLALIAGG